MTTSLFDALRKAIKTGSPLNKRDIKSRETLDALFKPTKEAMDTQTAREKTLELFAHVKAKNEWTNVALALHIVHTTCRNCDWHVEMTEDLLIKQLRNRDKTIRYTPIKSAEGFSDLSYIALHRQVSIPICHRCMQEHTVEFQSRDPRQMSFDFEVAVRNRVIQAINAA